MTNSARRNGIDGSCGWAPNWLSRLSAAAALTGGALAAVGQAAVLHVPAEYPTIQAALDAAANTGDEIIVAPGTYPEAINFVGKAVYLHSADGPAVTTINATGLNTSVVTCASREGAGTVLEGFTITGGRGTPEGWYGDTYGGGMYNSGSNPTVTNCTFTWNGCEYGGGMYNNGGSPTVTNCIFCGNWAACDGAGMNNQASAPTVSKCVFSWNRAASVGGGMINADSNPAVTHCTFIGNSAGDVWGTDGYGGGMYNSGGNPRVTHCTFSRNDVCGPYWAEGGGIYNSAGSPTVTNCILWDDVGGEISGNADVTYSAVQGGYAGMGNINGDPLFADPENGDFHLQAGSPCIDAGTNALLAAGSDADGRCRVMDGNGDAMPIIDMGPYEAPGPVLDCNGDGICDTQQPAEPDCNHNLIPDECDIAWGWSLDVLPPGGDGIPDECEMVYNMTQGLPYDHIQLALDAAAANDEIMVRPGTYPEAIDFLGKPVYLHSSDGAAVTIIDATGLDTSVVTCANGEGPGTVLEGFTITGGSALYGGGMYNSGSSPSVANCTFNGNWADSGGGMYNEGGMPNVTNCTFTGNTWSSAGGGMYNSGSSPIVTNCTFMGNTACWGAAGMHNDGSSPLVTNCTFNGNAVGGYKGTSWEDCYGSGGGMYNSGGNPTVTNCAFTHNLATGTIYQGSYIGGFGGGICGIGTFTNCTFSGNWSTWGGGGISGPATVTICVLWGDTPDQIEGGATVNFSDVQGGYAGIGNIDADPLFMDPNNGNFRLQAGSPCIDAGDPNFVPAPGTTDLDGRKRVWDGDADGVAVVDMGAYEFGSYCYGDLDCNGNCDFGDINPFVLALSNPAGYHAAFPDCDIHLADLNADGHVDFGDINPFVALLSEY